MGKAEKIYKLTMYSEEKTNWGFICLNFKPDMEKIGKKFKYDKQPKLELVERTKLLDAKIHKQDTFEDIEFLIDTIYLLFDVELDENYFECGGIF